MSVASLTHDDIDRILKYLDLPSSDQLPLSPIPFLKKYLPILPASLLTPFNQITSPRQRTVIRQVKARRMIYSSQSPLPDELIAERARLRWPLLWERMGGSSLPPPTAEVQDEERWVETSFLPGRSNTQHVKKLGGLLRGFEEEREMEGVVAARRMERRLDDQGEEFDEESDEEEDGPNGAHNVNGNDSMRPETVGQTTVAEQDEMRRAFEKKIMELFVDGLDVSHPTSCPNPADQVLRP